MSHEPIEGIEPTIHPVKGWDEHLDGVDGTNAYYTIAEYRLVTEAGDWSVWLRPSRVDTPETVREVGFAYDAHRWEVSVSGPDSTWNTRKPSLKAARAEAKSCITDILEGTVTETRSFMSDQ